VHDGGLSSVVNADGELLVATPAVLDDEQASAVPEVFITAHDGIAQGALVSGETLLVTGATGAVGLAAVQIGRERGARVLGISRSERGDAMLRSLNAEPFPDHGGVDGLANLAYRDSVDVVLELVGARNARGDLAALRPKGRMVFVAAQGNEDICFNLRDFKTKRAVLLGSTLRRRGRQAKIEAVRAFEKEVVPLLAEGAVKPTISKVFPVDEAQAAFDYMSTPGRLGKVLLAF
jgi:NADPH2:quinone reductase